MYLRTNLWHIWLTKISIDISINGNQSWRQYKNMLATESFDQRISVSYNLS